MSDDIKCHFCGTQDFWCGTMKSNDLWVRSKTCMSNEITLLVDRNKALEAKLAGMVSREAAIRACEITGAIGAARCIGIESLREAEPELAASTAVERLSLSNDTVRAHVRADAVAALARAEAEAQP